MNNISGLSPGVDRDELNYPFSEAFKVPVLTVYVITVAVAIVGNIMVCGAIILDKNLRSNPTTILLFSLAFSDLLTVTIVTPLEIHEFFLQGVYGEAMRKLWSIIFYIAVPTSILTLLAVSIDRYNHITDPLNRYRKTRFMTRKKAWIINCLIWLYSILFASIPLLGWPNYSKNESVIFGGRCCFPYTRTFITLICFLNFMLPLLITCGIYIKIYRIASVRNKSVTTARCECGKLTFTQETNRYIGNLKAAKTISMFVGVSFFCWVPYSMYIIICSVCKQCSREIPLETYPFLLMLGYLSSALNPFLFAFRSKSFKDFYAKMLRSVAVLKPKPRHNSWRSSTISQMTFTSEIPDTMERGIKLQALQSLQRDNPQDMT